MVWVVRSGGGSEQGCGGGGSGSGGDNSGRDGKFLEDGKLMVIVVMY